MVEDIYKNELEIYRLKKELDTLKIKYAQSIVFAYKNRSNYQYLNFLFSATNFNDAIKRVTYLKSYRTLRETQVDNIVKTQSVLQNKIGELSNSKKEQGVVLKAQQVHLQDLEQDKKQKAQVVKDLKGQEKEISAQIRKKELQRQQMKNAIAAIIFGKTKWFKELTPIISSASICSVIRIVPISEAIFDPILPANMSEIIVGENSRIVLDCVIYPTV